MFVAEEMLLDLGFRPAQARLADLAGGGLLAHLSRDAYGDGLTGLVRVGPLGTAPGMSKLVDVQFLDVISRHGCAVLALRWQATGLAGGLFPALDADIALTPAGEHSTRLSLAGSYRPPLGAVGASLDQALLHKVADATIRFLLASVADALTGARDSTGTGQDSDPA